MSSTYDFLRDEDELTRFVDGVVPDLGDDECLLLLLMARRKYLTEDERPTYALGNSAVFRRDIIRSKDQILSRVREMCVERGVYLDRDGRPLPDHAFSVYLTVNPRSERKAAVATVKEITDRLYDGQRIHLDDLVKSQLHQSVARKVFLDFDIDPEGDDDLAGIIARIRGALGSTPAHVITTRTGAHVVVETKGIDPSVKNTFFREVSEIGKGMSGAVEVHNDAMVPVPGTCQGGVMPKLQA
ncbi:MAG TPA: hypothetical protein VGB53_10290 [Rubricoccaceae bacterium]|jgi:hypothetical protein